MLIVVNVLFMEFIVNLSIILLSSVMVSIMSSIIIMVVEIWNGVM